MRQRYEFGTLPQIGYVVLGVTVAIVAGLILARGTAMADTVLAALQRPQPSTAVCSAGHVVVTAKSANDRKTACLGAAQAIGFLSARGLPVRAPVSVAVVDAFDVGGDVPLLGLYDPRTKGVQVLAGSTFESRDEESRAFGVVIDAEMQASIVAHEVTHAILDQYASDYPLDRASHEYLAYVVQLSVLAPEMRSRVLAKSDVDGFDALNEVNVLYLAFDPDRFGVNAYLHFHDLPDQTVVLAKLVRKSKHQAGMWE